MSVCLFVLSLYFLFFVCILKIVLEKNVWVRNGFQEITVLYFLLELVSFFHFLLCFPSLLLSFVIRISPFFPFLFLPFFFPSLPLSSSLSTPIFHKKKSFFPLSFLSLPLSNIHQLHLSISSFSFVASPSLQHCHGVTASTGDEHCHSLSPSLFPYPFIIFHSPSSFFLILSSHSFPMAERFYSFLSYRFSVI